MCIAIPSLVVSLKGNVATVECFNQRREVSTLLMTEPVAPGDYVSVLAGAHAVRKVSAEEAAESLAFLQTVLSESAAAKVAQ